MGGHWREHPAPESDSFGFGALVSARDARHGNGRATHDCTFSADFPKNFSSFVASGSGAALFTALSGVNTIFAPLSDLFIGRTDNVGIRFAASVALLFNVLMVIIAIIAIALTVPKDDPRAVASTDGTAELKS